MVGVAIRWRSGRLAVPDPITLSHEERDTILRLYWGARDQNPVRTHEGMTLYRDLPVWRRKRVELFLADRGIRLPDVNEQGYDKNGTTGL